MDIVARTDRLAQLLEERLDVRGKGFDAKLRRAGRLLPRHLRMKGQMLVDATTRADHPSFCASWTKPRWIWRRRIWNAIC